MDRSNQDTKVPVPIDGEKGRERNLRIDDPTIHDKRPMTGKPNDKAIVGNIKVSNSPQIQTKNSTPKNFNIQPNTAINMNNVYQSINQKQLSAKDINKVEKVDSKLLTKTTATTVTVTPVIKGKQPNNIPINPMPTQPIVPLSKTPKLET